MTSLTNWCKHRWRIIGDRLSVISNRGWLWLGIILLQVWFFAGGIALAEAVLTETYIWPVSEGMVIQPYRPEHRGIDITSASGTPIYASRDGVVLETRGDRQGSGYRVTLQHEDGSLTIYSHNRRILVTPQQVVQQGDVIALMGSTGTSNAPHLHFEIRSDTQISLNPLPLLPPIIAGRISPPDVINKKLRAIANHS